MAISIWDWTTKVRNFQKFSFMWMPTYYQRRVTWSTYLSYTVGKKISHKYAVERNGVHLPVLHLLSTESSIKWSTILKYMSEWVVVNKKRWYFHVFKATIIWRSRIKYELLHSKQNAVQVTDKDEQFSIIFHLGYTVPRARGTKIRQTAKL